MRLHARGNARGVTRSLVGRITKAELPRLARSEHVLLDHWTARSFDIEGYAAILSTAADDPGFKGPAVWGVPTLDYLDSGDVVALHPSGVVEVLFRRTSQHNTLLVTERCNSLCLMCSQPPKEHDDSWRVAQILSALDLIDPECQELGLSGGEPTLVGDGFFQIVQRAKRRLPNTALHILTNGRLFRNHVFAARLAEIQHPDLMLGIPLYSDLDDEHDFVVQTRGAYEETLYGLYNLAELGVPIELRVVIHRATYRRLPQLAEFIVRNLPFVSHVALMGLEMFGYVHLNLETVWIDPMEYQDQLEAATKTLALHDVTPIIFNHQLCVLRRSLWPFTVQSISDWKNVYLPVCGPCAVRRQCGGFFESGTKRHSAFIRPLSAELHP